MESIRSSSLVLHNQTKKGMNKAQADINKLSYQVSSGNKSENYAGLSDSMPIEAYLKTRNIVASVEDRVRLNELLNRKMAAMESSVIGLTDVIKDGLSLLVKAKDPIMGPQLNSDELSRQQLEKVKSLLNNQFNGQYLFSGSRVSTLPTGDFVNTSNIVSGNVTANYYVGDNVTQTAKISEESSIPYGIKASDAAMQKLIGAFHFIIEGKNLNDPTKFDQAYSLLEESKVEVNNLIAKLGNNNMMVDNQIEYDNALTIRFKEALHEVDEVDVTEAMGELVNIQVQLQASYMLMVRASSITLADYLR